MLNMLVYFELLCPKLTYTSCLRNDVKPWEVQNHNSS